MRVVVVVVALALAVAISCSVSHKSQDFACMTTADCSSHPGTVCDNGFCVVPGTIDAPGTKRDAPRGDGPPGDTGSNGCPTGCTSCNTTLKTCTIDCSQTSSVDCTNPVTCPAGYHCDIQCKLDNQCRNGVSCVDGASCKVECSGGSTCRNVECGLGPCDVTCSGDQSCRGVSCNSSCACDVQCSGSQSCAGTVTCQAPVCVQGQGCSSVLATCHTCQ